jgi:Flp pilus assembly pilin Flp
VTARPTHSRDLLRDRRGVAAIEFALMTPVFCLLLAGVVDLGGALYTKFKLDSAVTAGANFAQINAANVSSTGGPALATNIATIVETSEGAEQRADRQRHRRDGRLGRDRQQRRRLLLPDRHGRVLHLGQLDHLRRRMPQRRLRRKIRHHHGDAGVHADLL